MRFHDEPACAPLLSRTKAYLFATDFTCRHRHFISLIRRVAPKLGYRPARRRADA